MSSDDSDNEPLSSFISHKAKQESELEIIPIYNNSNKTSKKKTKYSKSCNLTIELAKSITKRVVERPADVWMYLKDLNRTGPYSCLLCSEWFINKTKLVLHYIVNHKKNFCSICRYFVIDDEAWVAHQNFHKPWSCSQCSQTFTEVTDLNKHFSEAHHLVHCKLCHATVPDNEEYNTHLLKKHNTSNINKDEDLFWVFENTNFDKFKCTLCAKSKISIKQLSNHYISFHHMTLKCLTPFLSNKNIDFSVKGADLTQHFIDTQLKPYVTFGYVDLEDEQGKESNKNESENILKQEKIEDVEMSEMVEMKPNLKLVVDPDKSTDQTVSDIPNQIVNVPNKYSGDDDFDITLMELVLLQKCYHDYIKQSLIDISSSAMPIYSINYETARTDKTIDITCSLCPQEYTTLNSFTTHMTRMHCVKIQSTFSCRVCVAPFDTKNELAQHVSRELGEFEDLWICQFCDKEFDNREQTRTHLSEHWNDLEYDNCFSPHLGFKCKYCPVLFWNEVDREKHHVNMHLEQYKGDFYQCATCDEVFSDKVWFTHHYLENHQPTPNAILLYILKCSICGLCLPSVEDMRIHFKLNHPDARKVFCSLGTCQHRPFSHKKSFQLHLKSLHIKKLHVDNEDDGRRSCGVCGEQFPSARSCAAHATQAHRLTCALCHLTLATLDERKIHYLIHHPGRHPFQCDKCDKSFQYKSSLYLHKQEHSSIKQDFTCNLCGKTFQKRDSYREHCAIHTGPRHACSYCPMVFVQRSNMLRHERRHTGERPYSCRYCPRTFADKGACTTHSRTHAKEPSFSCMYCGQSFVQKSKLTYHIRRHTGENLETCSECGKSFTSVWSLREHLKVHAKTKHSVKCPMCEKLFDDEKGMIRHMRRAHVRTGERHTCPICRKEFHSPSGLREHVISHSDTKIFKCNMCPKSCNGKRTIIRHLLKRHSIKSTDKSINQHFTKRDPRDCNLNLDVETMNNIFGPPKPKIVDIIIPNYVPVDNQKEMEESSSESDKDGDTVEVKMEKVEEEPEQEEEPDQELEPINFVSIKIESLDESDME